MWICLQDYEECNQIQASRFYSSSFRPSVYSLLSGENWVQVVERFRMYSACWGGIKYSYIAYVLANGLYKRVV